MTWSDYDAVLFDLDGVVTPTAEVHMRAWAEMFNAFLAGVRRTRATARRTPTTTTSPTSTASPATTGVRDFLASRGIPARGARRPPDAACVELGDRKNDAFNAVLERDGVTAYPGSVLLLDHLRDLGLPLAVVSSSVNAPAVLAAAGLADRFRTVVSGAVATELGLPGKPAPDTFLHAAEVLGATAAELGRARGRRVRGPRRRGRRTSAW